MNTIKELLPKPSDAITAMIEGLKDPNRKFKIDMYTYGESFVGQGDVCFGCAATATILKCFPDAPVSANLRWVEYGSGCFEVAINELRQGYTTSLANYYEVELPLPKLKLLALSTNNWTKNLHTFEAYRDQLIEAGL